MKKLKLFFLLLILCKYGYSQNYLAYYSSIDNAQVYMADSNYFEASKIYKTAFKKYDAFSDDYVDAYTCAVYLKKYNLAKKYIYTAVKKGENPSYIFDTISIDDGLQPKCNKITFNKNKLNRIRTNYLNKINLAYSIEILKIFGLDQGIRNSNLEHAEDSLIQKILSSDSIFKNKYIDLHFRNSRIIDSVNSKVFYELISENGFSRREILPEAYMGGIVILAHTFCQYKNYDYDSFIKQLKDLVIKGDIAPLSFARIFDKYYMAVYNCEYYGTLPSDKINLYDPINVDKRRSEIGLTPTYIREKITKRKLILKNFNNTSN